MRKPIVFLFFLLVTSSCSTPQTPPAIPATPTQVPATSSPSAVPSIAPTFTPTPWGIVLETAVTRVAEPTSVITPLIVPPSPTPTPALTVLCSWGGNGLVIAGNYIGPAEYYAELSINGKTCTIPAGKVGYLQLPPGAYDWSAGIPSKAKFGRTQGHLFVNSGVNSPEITLCLVGENGLALSSQCQPSGGSTSSGEPSPTPITPR